MAAVEIASVRGRTTVALDTFRDMLKARALQLQVVDEGLRHPQQVGFISALILRRWALWLESLAAYFALLIRFLAHYHSSHSCRSLFAGMDHDHVASTNTFHQMVHCVHHGTTWPQCPLYVLSVPSLQGDKRREYMDSFERGS